MAAKLEYMVVVQGLVVAVYIQPVGVHTGVVGWI